MSKLHGMDQAKIESDSGIQQIEEPLLFKLMLTSIREMAQNDDVKDCEVLKVLNMGLDLFTSRVEGRLHLYGLPNVTLCKSRTPLAYYLRTNLFDMERLFEEPHQVSDHLNRGQRLERVVYKPQTVRVLKGGDQVMIKKCQLGFYFVDRTENRYSIGWSSKEESEETGFLPVFSALLYGSPNSVRELLNHGFSIRSGNAYSPYTDAACGYFMRFHRSPDRTADDMFMRDVNESGHMESFKILCIVLYWIYKIRGSSQNEAQVPVSLARSIERICSSFRVLWRAIADPYPSKDDLLELQYRRDQPNVHVVVTMPEPGDLVKMYEMYFPDMTGNTRPRSLQHLTRCAVRKRRKYFTPTGLLPSSVVRYLNLES